MRSSDLQTFLHVAASHSFTRAAIDLGLSQSTVSSRIAALEGQVSAKLFTRHGSRVALTAAGQILLPIAQQIVLLSTQARDHIAASRLPAAEERQIRIGANSASASWLIPRIADRLTGMRPELQLVVTVSPTTALMHLLMESEIELAFVNPYMSYPLAEVVWSHESRCVLVASAADPAAQGTIALGDLSGHPFIAHSFGPGSEALEDLLSHLTARPRVRAYTNSTYLAELLIGAGLGVGFLPREAVEMALADGRLLEVRVDPSPVPPTVWRTLLVRWKGSPRSEGAEALIEMLRADVLHVESK